MIHGGGCCASKPHFSFIGCETLFTNVQKQDVIEVIRMRWPEIARHTRLSLSNFLDGICLLMENCYFTFDKQTYRQKDVTPMGSPVSPALAELVMEYVEREAWNIAKEAQITPAFYHRFVDDSITTVPSRKLEVLVNIFNSICPSIKFTHEKEERGSIPFLDVLLLRRDNGKITTKWNHKNTWNGRYLKFYSFLPVSYKQNTVSLLTRKIFELSDESYHDKNLDLLRKTLRENGYSDKFIDDNINRTIKKVKVSDPKPSKEKGKPLTYVTVPYESETFGRLRSCLGTYKIEVVAKPSTTLKKLLYPEVKDPIPKENVSGVVYAIRCSCDKTYIGNTEQHIYERFKQHNRGDVAHSALSAHIRETDHPITFDNMVVCCMEGKRKAREIKEMVYIKSTNNINEQTDSYALSDSYNHLLSRLNISLPFEK